MSITLIRSNSDGVVHGADNDKLTGCRKRLQTMSSTREGEMKDIVDLTCDRCKEYFAKKMIRESNREESRIAKEEKKRFLRAKKQGIVSEATYEEYVINRESEASAKRDSKRNTDSQSIPLKADLPENNYPSYQNYNQQAVQPAQQPATYEQPIQNPQIQNDYPVSQPQYTNYQPMKQSVSETSDNSGTVSDGQLNKKGLDDDFLSQFMINKTSQGSAQNESNSKPVIDVMSAAKSAANDILSQLESEFGPASSAGKPVSSDASSFYSNQIPLVDAKASTNSFESVTNEFGTFNMPQESTEKPSTDINDFAIPEVPSLHSYSEQKTTDDSPYINELTASVQNKINSSDAINSFDSLNHPNINTSVFDALDAVQASIGTYDNTVSSFSTSNQPSIMNEFESVLPVQPPMMNGFESVPPVQPQKMNGFESVPPVQPQMMNGFESVPPVQSQMMNGFESVPPVQPQMMNGFESVPPVQPQMMNGFESVQPPVQPQMMNGFESVPPVQPQMMNGFESVPPVQPQMMNGFESVPPVQPQMMNGFESVPPVQPQMMNGFEQIPPVQPQMMNGFESVPPVQPPMMNGFDSVSPVQPPMMNGFESVQPMQSSVNNFNSVTPVQTSNQQHEFIMPPLQATNTYTQNNISKQINQSGVSVKKVAVIADQARKPMIDSIEDALKQLGAADSGKKENGVVLEKEEIVPDFVAYVPSSSKVLHTAPPINDYTSSASKKTMSAREAKKAAKIDAKFRKELKDRGYSQEEIKLQRRGK